jgi:hypothetical protein
MRVRSRRSLLLLRWRRVIAQCVRVVPSLACSAAPKDQRGARAAIPVHGAVGFGVSSHCDGALAQVRTQRSGMRCDIAPSPLDARTVYVTVTALSLQSERGRYDLQRLRRRYRAGRPSARHIFFVGTCACGERRRRVQHLYVQLLAAPPLQTLSLSRSLSSLPLYVLSIPFLRLLRRRSLLRSSCAQRYRRVQSLAFPLTLSVASRTTLRRRGRLSLR